MLWVTNKRKELVLCYSYEKKVTQIQQAPQNRYIYLQNFNHMPLLESAKFYFSMSKTLVMNTWAVKVPFKQDHTFSAVTSPYRHSAWVLVSHGPSGTFKNFIDFSPNSPSWIWKTCLHSILPSFEMVWLVQRVANRCLREWLNWWVIYGENTQKDKGDLICCQTALRVLVRNHICAWTASAESHTLLHTWVHRTSCWFSC